MIEKSIHEEQSKKDEKGFMEEISKNIGVNNLIP